MKFKKILVIILASYFLLLVSSPAFAQTQKTVEVPVGKPPPKEVVTAGIDIYDAYGQCHSGKSFDNPSSPSSCTKYFLLNKNYPQERVDSFETRRISSLVGHYPGYCSECLGYVSTTLALAHNASNALRVGNPLAVLNNGNTFTVGTPTVTYVRVYGASPKPGDVGIGEAGWGHILIVKSLVGEGKFVGLESNWGYDCSIRNFVEHPNAFYTYYRKSEQL